MVFFFECLIRVGCFGARGGRVGSATKTINNDQEEEEEEEEEDG